MAGEGVDGLRLDAVPYLVEREGPTARTAERTRAPEAAAAMAAKHPGACGWKRANSGRRSAPYFAGKTSAHASTSPHAANMDRAEQGDPRRSST